MHGMVIWGCSHSAKLKSGVTPSETPRPSAQTGEFIAIIGQLLSIQIHKEPQDPLLPFLRKQVSVVASDNNNLMLILPALR